MLQLWLQPYLQGYPPFADMPHLYKLLSDFDDFLMEFDYESLDWWYETLKSAVVAAEEFFNVRNPRYHPWVQDAKDILGKYMGVCVFLCKMRV